MIATDLRDGETFTNNPSQMVVNLSVAGHRFRRSGKWIGPNRVGGALAQKQTAVMSKVL